MDNISNLNEFKKALEISINDINQLFNQNIDNSWIESILNQLKSLKAWFDESDNPSIENIRKLNFGLLASKELDDNEPEIAEKLYDLANFLDTMYPAILIEHIFGK